MAVAILLGCTATLTASAGLPVGGEIVAVASKASDDYIRTKSANGSFQPETYAFGEGGTISGPYVNHSIDDLKFMDLARLIAIPLATQQYLPSHDPAQTKLLIMVYWGTTTGAREDPSLNLDPATPADGYVLDRQNVRLAPILGYDSAIADGFRYRGTALEFITKDLFEELAYNRYFVVLMAYDFQLMWREKKHKLLWETRFSISERGNAFDEQLPGMVLDASRYFGRDSHGLVHKTLPEGRVDLGELNILGVIPEKKEGN